MAKSSFEKIRKDCPWLHQPQYYNQEVCRASSFTVRASAANFQPGFRWVGNLDCNRKNCAVYHWLKKLGVKDA